MLDPVILSALEGYDAWASTYDDDGNPLTAIEGDEFLQGLGPIEGSRVLDLGCGTGRHAMMLVAAGASVIGVDASAEMMARARFKLRGSPVEWLRVELPAPLPFPADGFDLVVMGLVADHVEDLASLIREAHRVTKPGGRCFLSALHPDRTAQGQQARFIDPTTGLRRQVATLHRSADDYLAIAEGEGWLLIEARSLAVPEALGEALPRARPYVGQNLGWAAWWRKA